MKRKCKPMRRCSLCRKVKELTKFRSIKLKQEPCITCLNKAGYKVRKARPSQKLKSVKVKKEVVPKRPLGWISCKTRKLITQFIKVTLSCQICGYNSFNKVLEFHHLDKETKSAEVCRVPRNEFFIEVKKCILLCSNCHKEVEYNHVHLDRLQVDIMRHKIHNLVDECERHFGYVGRANGLVQMLQSAA